LNVEIIAEKVKARRRLLGIDQKSVAELSGISVHTLSDIESAKGNPSLKMLCKVLEAIGLEMRLELKRLGYEPYRNAADASKQAGIQ